MVTGAVVWLDWLVVAAGSGGAVVVGADVVVAGWVGVAGEACSVAAAGAVSRSPSPLLAQRDLPSWGLPSAPQTTRRLFGLFATRHGQLWNASDIGRALGLSHHTVNAYLDYLEGAFLIRRLPAYSANPSKQFTKRPKMYWRDTGLLHSLLGLGIDDEIASLPAVGASWEGHVIDQLLAGLNQAGHDHEAWHLRTATGREIDLVLRIRREIWAVEIKLTTQPRGADMARLDETADLIGAHRKFLVSRQPESFGDGVRTACDLAGMITAATH